MFHPVGSQPPSVYWRRRLVFFAAIALLIVLIILTANALRGGDGKASASSTSRPPASPAATHPTSPKTSHSTSSSSAKSSTSKSGSSTSSPAPTTSGTPTTPIAHCTAKSLSVSAVVGQTTYKAGEHPLLQMQVTNTGAQPCVQDLADKQVELRVYNGESRVWGSHDCKTEPGTLDRTLSPNVAVKVAITWTGMSSRAGCKGTRQQVGAGSYTLYASLAGHEGKAAQFSIS